MLILASPFTRDLVFFGVIDILLAVWGLYGLTRLIGRQVSLKTRLLGLAIMMIVLVLLVISSLLAVRYTLK